jgi:hypothetical protein
MGRPEQRASRVSILVAEVETSPGSGDFAPDERLRVDRLELGVDDTISTARLAVCLDDSFDFSCAELRYGADTRVVIRTNESDVSRRRVLFDGIVERLAGRWLGENVGGGEDSADLYLRHVMSLLAVDRRVWIVGRYMRNGLILDGVSSEPAALIEAMPCVFNRNGVANCDPVPIFVTDHGGVSRTIFIFSQDDDQAAVPWTFLNALRYLLWFYGLPEGPVDFGGVFDATEPFVGVAPGEVVPDIETSTLIRSLLGRPHDVSCEGENLLSGLALMALMTGTHVECRSESSGGVVTSELRWWAGADGSAKTLELSPAGRYADGVRRFDSSAVSAPEVFSANRIHRALLAFDRSRLVNAPIVVGGVRKYEMTMPLWPGWVPEDGLDDVAEVDRAAAKAVALTPELVEALGGAVALSPWYQKYHRGGSDYDAHRAVTRHWVLNEDGRFDGATYNRNVPFDDYGPFDFASVTDDSVTTFGAWTRRARRFEPTITRSEMGEEFGVWVEFSFDAGVTWHEPTGPVDILENPTGLWIDVGNPLSITPAGVDPADENMWYALVDQIFRVRVTAVMESDDRLISRFSPVESRSRSLRARSRMVYRPGLYRFVSRDGTTDALASVNPDDSTIGRNDTDVLDAEAARIAIAEDRGRVLVLPGIPWIDVDCEIGDRIVGVRGRSLRFGRAAAEGAEHPVIIGKRYRFDDGRFETELVVSLN